MTVNTWHQIEIRDSIILLIFSMALIGSMSSFASETPGIPADYTQPVSCGGDEENLSLYLKEMLKVPKITKKDFGIKSRRGQLPFMWFGRAGRAFSTRLDLCFNLITEEVSLKRIVFKHLKQNLPSEITILFDSSIDEPRVGLDRRTYRTPLKLAKIRGLKKALHFDPSELEIEIPLAIHQGRQLSVFKMRTINKQGKLITLSWLENSTRTPELYLVGSALVGAIDLGDPFEADAICGVGKKRGKYFLKAGTARFAFDSCNWHSGTAFAGYTSEYSFLSLRIQDLNESLSLEEKKVIKKEASDFDGFLDYQVEHHNFCDEFKVTTGFATYWVFTGSSHTHCIPKDLPKPKPIDGARGIPYLVKYHDQPWQAGWAEVLAEEPAFQE